MDEKVKVKIEVDNKDLKTEFDKSAKDIESGGKKIEGALGGIGSAVKTLLISYVSLQTAMKTVKFLDDAANAFMESQENANRLGAALDAVGAKTKIVLPMFEAFAQSMQKQTRYNDEAIVSAMTFGKNLGITTGQLEDATTAAIGLASKYKIDLESAMQLVGRASQGQTQMLARYGIVLNESLTPQQKFNELLNIGQKSFALATEDAKSYAGQIDQLKNMQDDRMEAIGANVIRLKTAWEQAKMEVLGYIAALLTVPAPEKADRRVQLKADITGWEQEIERIKEASGKGATAFMVNGKFEGLDLTVEKAEAKIRGLQNSIRDAKKELIGITEDKTPEAPKAAITKEQQDQKLRDQQLKDLGLLYSDKEYLTTQNEVRISEIKKKFLEERAEAERANNEFSAETDRIEDEKEIEREKIKNEKIRDLRQSLVISSAGIITQIAAMNKNASLENFNVYKAAAIAEAGVVASLNAIKALGNPPFPGINIAAAILAGTLGAVQIANIVREQPPQFEHGGIVGGYYPTGDKVLTRQNSGEMNLNMAQQLTLFKAIQRGTLGGAQIHIGGDTIVIQGNADNAAVAAISGTRERQLTTLRQQLKELDRAGQIPFKTAA